MVFGLGAGGRRLAVWLVVAGLVASLLAVVPGGAAVADPEVGESASAAFVDGTELVVSTAVPRPGEELGVSGWARIGGGSGGADSSVVLVYDVSGSAGWSSGSDCTGDGVIDSVLTCQRAAMSEFVYGAGVLGSVKEMAVVRFAASATTVDVRPDVAGVQAFTAPGADHNDNGVPDVIDAFSSGGTSGGTNYAAAASRACAVLDQASYPNRYVVFLSDGQPESGSAARTVLPCGGESQVPFHTFAIGDGVTCATQGTGNRGSLQEVADLTGGTCTTVADVSVLRGLLGQLARPEIVGLSVSVDGGDAIDLGGDVVPGLPVAGPDEVVFDRVLGQLAVPGSQVCVTAVGQRLDEVLEVTHCVVVPPGEVVVDAGDDVAVVEGDLVTLAGGVEADGPVSIRWSVVSSTGSPIELLGADSLSPSFRVWDDGVYELEVEAVGATTRVSDRVTVTVTNAAPVIGVEAAPSTGDGTVMVTASVADPGVLDTHRAVVDWGDGSDPVEVAAVTQGAGWAVLSAAHVYEAAGEYEVAVTVVDDDGGSVATSTVVAADGQGPPTLGGIGCALCVLGTGNGQGSATVDMNGQANWTIRGGVHSNGSFKIQSPGRLSAEPEGSVSVVAGGISCTNIHDPNCPPPHVADAEPLVDPLADLVLPTAGTPKQWRCNNTCVVEPGTYRGPFNHNPGTKTQLLPGTYVFTGEIFAVGGTIEMHPSARPDEGVTLVFVNGSSLEIRNQGSLKLRPPSSGDLAGLVVAYERTSNRTLGWRGSRNALTGTVYAPAAQLRFDGDAPWTSMSRFIVGTASSQTSTVVIDTTTGAPNAGDRPDPVVVGADPVVVPRSCWRAGSGRIRCPRVQQRSCWSRLTTVARLWWSRPWWRWPTRTRATQ